jgi:hypothetical protein
MKYLLLALLVGCATSSRAGDDPEESEIAANLAAVTCSGSWTQETSPASSTTILHAVWAATATADVFAVGDDGAILRRTSGAWTAMASGTTNDLRGVWGASASDVWATGTSGTLLHYNGAAWSAVSGATTDIDAVWGSSGSDVWFVGSTAVLHYNGAAVTTATGFSGPLLAVSGTSPSDVWVTGENTKVHHYNGSAWATLTPPVGTSTLMTVLAVAPNDAWVADFTPSKDTAHWNGSAWTTTKSGALLNSLSALSTGELWGAGNSGRIAHWNGSAWSLETPCGSVALWSVATRPGDGWVVGDGGLILHRTL